MSTLVSPDVPLATGQVAELSESEAIRLAQRGDARAFEHLYRLHSRRIYRLCLRMIGNTPEAEDLTQEAFLRLFRKIQTFRGESAFSSWLYRLAVNVVLMHVRKRTVQETGLEHGEEQEIGTRDLRINGVLDRVWLKDAIGRLPEEYRLIPTLHDVKGFEHHQIAARLKCSVSASKSQLHRARVCLRKLLVRAPGSS